MKKEIKMTRDRYKGINGSNSIPNLDKEKERIYLRPGEELICKGSIYEGNGCMKCAKCIKEITEFQRRLEVHNKVHGICIGITGWTCPRCGTGLSPNTSRCPCIPIPVSC